MTNLVQTEPLSDATTARQRRRAFQILFFCLLCVGLGQSLLFAVLPPLAREMGLTEVQTGSIFTVSAVLWVFMAPFWGRQSDIWGRKPLIILGLVAYAVSMLFFAFSFSVGMAGLVAPLTAYVMLACARSLYGLFGSGTMPSAQAYVADRTDAQERAGGVAMVSNAFSLGTVLGPAVAGALVVVGLIAPLYFVVGLALASATTVWLFLPERRPPNAFEREAERKKQKTTKKLSPFDRRIFPLLLIGFAVGNVQAMTFQTIAFFIMDKLQLAAHESIKFTSAAFLATALAALFAQFVLIGRFRLSTRVMVRSGLLIALCANLFIAMSFNYAMIICGFFVLGTGIGLVRPGIGASASLAVKIEEQGAVAGLTTATAAAGHIIGPLMGPALYRYLAPESPYILNSVILMGCIVFIYARNLSRFRVSLPPQEFDSGMPEG